MKRVAASLFVLGVLALVVWQSGQRIRPFGQTGASTGRTESGTVPERLEPAAVPGATASLNGREPTVEASRFRGFVRDSSGGAVAGAHVRWIALEPEDRERTVAWPGGGYGRVERACLETLSGDSGKFEFGRAPRAEMEHGSVLVLTHPAHLPGGLDLLDDGAAWPAELSLTLGHADPFRVRVLHADRSPAAGATVEQVGYFDPDMRTPIFRRFLEQRSLCDAEGTVSLVPFPGGQSLSAELGDAVARPWVGTPWQEVELVLGETVQLAGALTLPDWTDWDATWHGEQRIVITGLVKGDWRPLTVLRDVTGPEWGPVDVPISDVKRVRARLEGIPIIPVQHEFAPPAPGGSLRIDFSTAVGLGVWFYLANPVGEPVLNGRATVWWDAALENSDSRRVTSSSRANGRIFVGTFPSFPVFYRIEAPGFATVEGELLEFEDVCYTIELQPEVAVVGRCLSGDKPVEEFEILRYVPGSRAVHRQKFEGRVDGSFELDGVPAGSWAFQALSHGSSPSAPRVLELEAGRSAEFVLRLPQPKRGFGRVIDAQTGAGVDSAEVQALVALGEVAFEPWGDPHFTHADGSFELHGSGEGIHFLAVQAEGYARVELKGLASGEAPHDWGVVALHRPQELVLRAMGAEQLPVGTDIGDLRVYDAAGRLGVVHFDHEGLARFRDVPPGEHYLVVQRPDLTWAKHHLACVPGVAWSFEVSVAGERRIDVLATDQDGGPLPFEPTLLVSGQEDGRHVVREAFQKGGVPATFDGVQAQRVRIEVRRGSEEVASRSLELPPGELEVVEIRVGEAPTRVHVSDVEGQALEDAWVAIRTRISGERVTSQSTGSDGWAELHGVPGEDLIADVVHSTGWRFGVPFDGRAREHELVLDNSSAIELYLHDAGEPLEGVDTRLETPGGTGLTRLRASDAEGLVRYGPIGPGRYRFVGRRADVWTASVESVLGSEEEQRVELELRRLGTLELQLFGIQGQRLPGVAVELVCEDLGVSVADWLAEGRLEVPAGLVTDPEGRLVVSGLPRGRYSWRGGEGAGSFELAPGAPTRVEARPR